MVPCIGSHLLRGLSFWDKWYFINTLFIYLARIDAFICCVLFLFLSQNFPKSRLRGVMQSLGIWLVMMVGRGCNCVVAATVVIAKSEVVWHSAK